MDKPGTQGYYLIVNCEEAMREMDAFLSGDITDERQSAFLAHAASCPDCQKVLKDMRRRSPGAAATAEGEKAIPPTGGNGRRLASLNPAIFAGVLLLLLGGVVAAMKMGPDGYGLFAPGAQKFDEADFKAAPRPARPSVETLPVTPEAYREEKALQAAAVEPAAAMREGLACFEKNDFNCALANFRQVVAGRGPRELREEARYRVIATCARLKRCAEVILQTSALEKESPGSRWIGEAFLRNAECHKAQGDTDYARLVYQNVAAKFPALREAAMTGIGTLGTPLQNKPDP